MEKTNIRRNIRNGRRWKNEYKKELISTGN